MKRITVNSEQQLNEMVARAIRQGNFAQKINDGGGIGAKILDSDENLLYKIVLKCGGLY